MGEKFQNRYRISSARLKNWDYRSNGMYFITICCYSRVHHFGEVVNGSMRLSDTGKICDNYLNAIPAHFPFLLLDAAVVMPDHLHAIIVIDGVDLKDGMNGDDLIDGIDGSGMKSGIELGIRDIIGDLGDMDMDRDVACNVCTADPAMAAISPKYGSLATVVRSFKSAVNKDARLINPRFKWQARFHDHIIRDEGSHQRIKNYINENPRNWGK